MSVIKNCAYVIENYHNGVDFILLYYRMVGVAIFVVHCSEFAPSNNSFN